MPDRSTEQIAPKPWLAAERILFDPPNHREFTVTALPPLPNLSWRSVSISLVDWLPRIFAAKGFEQFRGANVCAQVGHEPAKNSSALLGGTSGSFAILSMTTAVLFGTMLVLATASVAAQTATGA